jgi:hypothetical protein
MNKNFEMILTLAAVAVVAVWGALASKAVKAGGHWLWYYTAGMASIGTWTWMARRSPWSLMVSSVAWDIVYSLAFLGTMVFCLGEAGTRSQIAGTAIIFVGLVVMNW